MRTILFFALLFIIFASCMSSPEITPSSVPADIPVSQNVDPETIITVNNPTMYDVYFERNQQVAKNSNGSKVSLSIESATLTGGFDILYEIPLSDTVSLFCKGDHRTIREKQTSFTIVEPDLIDNYGIFIKLVNKANNAISFYSGGTANPGWEQKGSPLAGNHLTWTDKREFSPNETTIFNIGQDSQYDYFVRDSRQNIPLLLPKDIKKNFIYTYEYSTGIVQLADSRPLCRAGEAAWAKSITEAEAPVPFIANDKGIGLFSPGRQGLFRYTYDSAGNSSGPVRSDEGFDVTFAALAGEDFLVIGYEEFSNGSLSPAVKIIGRDSAVKSLLEPSSPRASEYFMAAAQQDSAAWLAVGGSERSGSKAAAIGIMAYARLIKNAGGVLAADWELTGPDFNAKMPNDLKCGEIKSAAYDSLGKRWLAAGDIIASDSMKNRIKGAYVAFISADGKVQTINTSFTGISIYKLVCDSNGGFYLFGEEQKGNETCAILLKFGADGKQLWRAPSQPAAHSWYQEAIIDGNRLIAGGVMRSRNSGGEGGHPFVEAVNMENGALLWREELSGIALRGTALVTAITPAPDYGFAITLAGIDSNGYAKPFMLARINSQGKFYQYK